ncbi:MAG: hypothetical protein ABWY14_07155 [Tardiphaga sp.]
MSARPVWRDDVDALAFAPDDHDGLCMVHRHAFRTLLRAMPSPQQCEAFFQSHQEAFQAAACAKILRARVAAGTNFHLTSRDLRRQLKMGVATPAVLG